MLVLIPYYNHSSIKYLVPVDWTILTVACENKISYQDESHFCCDKVSPAVFMRVNSFFSPKLLCTERNFLCLNLVLVGFCCVMPKP